MLWPIMQCLIFLMEQQIMQQILVLYFTDSLFSLTITEIVAADTGYYFNFLFDLQN